jgi:hypothetical protein
MIMICSLSWASFASSAVTGLSSPEVAIVDLEIFSKVKQIYGITK